VGLHPD